jgi:hypothetical protein
LEDTTKKTIFEIQVVAKKALTKIHCFFFLREKNADRDHGDFLSMLANF